MLKCYATLVAASVAAALAVSAAAPAVGTAQSPLANHLPAVPLPSQSVTVQAVLPHGATQDVPSNAAIPNQTPGQGTTTDRTAIADSTAPDPYDPLAILHPQEIAPLDLEFTDEDRQRKLPVRVYLPANSTGQAPTPQPVVLFSHGLGGSRQGSTFLGQHWAKRGYIAVFLQHPGSDEEVWRNTRLNQRRSALVQAANSQQLNARKSDVVSVLDQLEKWNQQPAHPLVGRMDLTRVGMSGHSFGARTTQQVSGENPWGRAQTTDKRLRAAIVMSPSVPATGNPDRAFRNVTLPWLLMTGTNDDSPLGDQTPESRRRVYPALPPGDKYELVLNDAEHSVFTDRRLPGEAKPRRPEHHRSILALSTAFWDAYLRDDPAAKTWLQGTGPRSILDTADLWQTK